MRVVVGGGGDYFEVMTSELDQTKGQGQLFAVSIKELYMSFYIPCQCRRSLNKVCSSSVFGGEEGREDGGSEREPRK